MVWYIKQFTERNTPLDSPDLSTYFHAHTTWSYARYRRNLSGINGIIFQLYGSKSDK